MSSRKRLVKMCRLVLCCTLALALCRCAVVQEATSETGTESKQMKNPFYVPSTYHVNVMEQTKQELEWTGQPLEPWQDELRARLLDLMGWFPEKKCDLNVRELQTRDTDTYTMRKLVYTSEPYAEVPCYLLVPKQGKPPYPAMVCLQGHNPGMHLSVGIAHNKAERDSIAGDRDFAIQAVNNGFVALAIEQRCFGERRETLQEKRSDHGCHDAVMHSLMLGRTVISERVWDVMRGIDYLETLPEVDASRIACMGNSGGGTITFYAACVEPRIKLAVPSCWFCTFADSVMRIYHCADNYIPGILKVAEVADLAGLIVPRKLIVVAGEQDDIFPIEGVHKAFEKAKKIFAAAGCADNCRLVVGPEGHRFYAEPTWPVVHELMPD